MRAIYKDCKKKMLKNLIIRPERPEDYKDTELMTMRSFWNKYFPGCVEHNMLRVIRASADYLPEISRIAEVDGKIAGAVYYTKAWITDAPDIDGKADTRRKEVAMLAKNAGIAGIILAGEPDYYPKFGFKRCAEFGITDGEGNSYDAYMCLPLNNDFASFKGHFVESADFAKIADQGALEKISREFPSYRKVKVQESFMQIFKEHLGVVESVKDDVYMVRYWELLIPCRLGASITEKPIAGSDVQFDWNHKADGESKITRLIKNLL